MPRVKKRALARTGYTKAHFQELMGGHAYLGPGFYYSRLEHAADYCIGGGGTPQQAAVARAEFDAVVAEMRELWEDSRDWLLGEWMDPGNIPHITGWPSHDQHGPGPCTRPWAWWTFDATEPRRQTSDGPANSTMTDGLPGEGKLNYGIPQCFAAAHDWNIEYESQGEYLERLDLFHDDDERAWWELHKDDPPPADDEDDTSSIEDDDV